MKVARKLWTWALALVATFALVLGLSTVAYAAAGDVPDHDKILVDNGDGTYTIALNVTGDSEKDPQKVNVIVIVDRSNSMNEQSGTGAYVSSNGTTANMFGLIDGEYVPLTRSYSGGQWVYSYDGQQYTGQRYIYDATASRIQATRAAVDGLASTLLGYNGKDGNPNDTVQMALVDFATSARTLVSSTTDAATFTNAVNGITPPGGNAGGTNWEMALRQADTINFGDNDPTYVIFFSDGAPTFYGTGPSGTGGEQEPNMSNSYNASTDEAAALATKVGKDNFYTIFAYGSNAGQTYMTNLTAAAGAPAGNNYSASNTVELEEAFGEILSKIELAGIGNVGISDGTTSNVGTSTEPIDLLEVVPNFKYYRAGGEYSDIDDYDPENGQYGQEWTGSDVPQAQFNDPTVTWNIPGVLENDVIYTVTFDCYPSQTTLDDVADIKNNPGETGAWADLDPAVQQYIDVNGNLKTNTTATLSWTDTRTGESSSDPFDNPDPVENSAVEQLAVTKKWDNQLEDEWNKPTSIDLDVTRDGDPHYTVSLRDPDWSGSVYVSIGIMGADGQPLEGSEGHDFTFTEPQLAEGFRWEIDAPVVHPMLINNVPTILIKVDAAHPAPQGARTYTFNNATYYVDSEAASLTATNERRSSLNIMKVVDGEDAPAEAVFPFTLNVVNSLAPDEAPSETQDPGHDSDWWVWISVRDMSETDDPEQAPPVTDAVVSGATHAGGGWYYGVSGENIVLNVKDGYSIRVNNLPTGTTYTITEGTLPTGFTFDSSEIAFVDGLEPDPAWAFSGDQTSTGSIDSTNALYAVTYTNKYELIDINVDKVWVDASNQDGIRPESLTLTLNGAPEGTTVPDPAITKSEDGNTWTYVWKGLPRFDSAGEEITYTVSENTVPGGYTCETTTVNDGGTITNTHEPEVIDIPVEKIWKGPEGDAVTVTLYADDVATTNTVTLNANNSWKGTFEDLPKKAAGKDIKYTVVEAGVSGVDASKYTTTITGDAENGFVITNTNTETVDIEVTKAWADASNQDGIRPENLTLTLNGAPEGTTVPDPAITKSGDNWTYKWTGLPKYTEEGTEIQYTVSEDEVPSGYTKSPADPVSTGGTITNTHEPEVTEATVVKVWDDAENQDGKRPTELKVTLSNGTEVTLTAANQWTQTVSNLPKFADGVEIVYTWTEGTLPDGYELTGTSKEGTVTTLTNSYTPEVTEATVKKVWDDAENQDGKRPTELKVTLSNGAEVTLSEDNSWTQTVSNLPKYADGVEIEYTWTEGTLPEGYTLTNTSKDGTVTTLTNSYAPEETSATVKKVWDDANDQDRKRPTELKVTLSNGTEVTLTADNNWTQTVSGLPKFADGVEIEYTWTEGTLPEGYTLSKTEKDGTVTTLTNSYTPEETEATVKKVWDDAENQDGKRPESLTVTLSDGEHSVTLSEDNEWTATVTGLPKYSAGQEIEYTWTEGTLPEGYTLSNTSKEGTVTTLTNSYTPEVTEATVKKVWDDADNQDGIRPASLEVTLSNGTKVTLSESNNWTQTVSGLPKFADGVEIEYTWTEGTLPEGYELTGTSKEGTVTTLTNSHTPEETEATVKKVWDDAENQDGFRPETLTVTLSDGQTVTLSEDNGWTATVTGLPKYADGVEIVYTWTEASIAEYTLTGAAKDGTVTTLTNRHVPEQIEIEVEKVWVDADNQDGFRPDSVTVNLLADGDVVDSVELNDDNEWTYTWTKLDKYAGGEEIEYTVEEVETDVITGEDADGTYKDEVTGDIAEGYIVTNTHTPVTVDVSVEKVWDDDDDRDGKRPDDLEVTLSNGDTVTLSEDNNWKATIEGLPKYDAGVEIEYTWTEASIEDYTLTNTATEGYVTTLTNSHTPELTTVTVTKVWDDADDKDGIRPTEITVTLLADGTEAGTTVLSESNSWTYTWTDLYKYAEGKEIAYTVFEEPVKDYDDPEITGTAADGYTIKNHHIAKPDAVMSDPPVQKVVQGNPPTPATFTFQMKAMTEGAPMPDGSADGIMTIQITGTGSKEFGEMWFEEAGEWVYEITELNGGVENYTYDTSVYTLTIKVEEVPDGSQVKLVKTETITGGNGSGSAVFTNVYKPPVPKTGDTTPQIGMLALGAALVAGIAAFGARRRED